MPIDDLVITNHAEDRFKSRTGLPKRLVTRNARKALAHGVSHADATGALRKYFDKLYLQEQTANNIRIYNGAVYIFCNTTLVTVYPVPSSLRKIAEKIQRRKQDGGMNIQ